MVKDENEIHKRLTNFNDIAAAIRKINDRINGCGFSFKEDSDGLARPVALAHISEADNAMIILASFDFSYYHDLELVFYNVTYSDLGRGYGWWDHWTKDQLEVSGETRTAEGVATGFEFRFNRGSHSNEQYIIRASAFSYYDGHVSYSR